LLLSLLLSLSPLSSVPILGPLGRPAQAWFLQQVTCYNPALGARLHDQNGLKPYTVSTLLDDRGHAIRAGRWLEPGASCWLRFTSLEEKLSELVLKKIIPNLPDRVRLYEMEFRLDGWTLERAQHPWASQSDYVNLVQELSSDARLRQVRLEFASPTAFRVDQADLPLPLPGSVFRSYWQKWNAFAPETLQIHEKWPAFAAQCITVSELTGINSEQWRFAEGTHGAATGFTGTVSFNLLPRHQCLDWREQWVDSAPLMQTLTRFAFYCGTGHHTTVGLGQTRLLPGEQRRIGSLSSHKTVRREIE
jgi:CRISPR-associated endoribonuclease Cas6